MAEAGHRVLLTCFNRPLAEYLRAGIGLMDNVDVFTFHGLAEELATRAGLAISKRHADADYFDVELPQALADAAAAMPEHRYDAIVVDEAQDIDSVWWLPLLDLLADPERGVLFVFGDANQDLYHADPDEIGVVMPERPPVYLLEENRRTTRAIHDWAQRWASDRPIQTDAGAVRVQARAAGPEGRPVQVLTYPEADADACRRAVASVLKELVGPAGDVKPRDIVVLTPRSPRSPGWAGGRLARTRSSRRQGPRVRRCRRPPPPGRCASRPSIASRGSSRRSSSWPRSMGGWPRTSWRAYSTWVPPGPGRTSSSSAQRE